MPEFDLGTQTVPLIESRMTNDRHGRLGVQVGTKTGRVTVHINLHKLTHLAKRALRNTNGKATLANGAIVFTVDRATLQEHRP